MSEEHFSVQITGWNNGEVTGQCWDVSLEPSSPQQSAIRDVLQSVTEPGWGQAGSQPCPAARKKLAPSFQCTSSPNSFFHV